MKRNRRRTGNVYRSGSLSYTEDKSEHRRDLLREMLRWILTTAAAAAAAVLVVWLAGYHISVPDDGMEPALVQGAQVLVQRTAYRLRSPEVGDVVAYYPGGDQDLAPLIGRVSAGPTEPVDSAVGKSGSLTLEEDEYYILTDTGSGEDSEDPFIGPVKETDILGRVWLALPGKGQKLHLVR